MRLRWLTSLALCGAFILPVFAQPPAVETQAPAAAPGQEAAPVQEEPSREQRLAQLIESIKAARTERAGLKKELKRAPAEGEAKQIGEDIERVSRRIAELETAFEELATGGLTTSALEQEAEEKKFDWKQELEDIVRPLLEELKRWTERPRTIERLRSERALNEDRLETTERALARIDEALAQVDSPALKKALGSLREEWKSYHEDAASGLQRVSSQLERLLAPEEEEKVGIGAAVREFFSGRGLNLAMALAAFGLSLALMSGLARLILWLLRHRQAPGLGRWAKVTGLLFRVVTVAVATFAAMVVLSLRGDWLILGLLILLLIGVLLTLRQSLTHFVREVRIILNMGGVREGERVLYGGVPWRIKSLNLFSTLHNPLLSGGTIRVPLGQMEDLQSRQYTKEEPWFPSREGDFVILDGDVFGKVLLQTPELVQLQVVGSTKTYPLADYLAKNPRNLSLDGFVVPLVFGLDYRHQAEILSSIVPRVHEHLAESLRREAFGPHLLDLLVDFNEAASSSLNLIVVVKFSGGAAEHYWSIRRFLQRSLVSACNEHGWVIPFEQLTVQLRPGEEESAGAARGGSADSGR